MDAAGALFGEGFCNNAHCSLSRLLISFVTVTKQNFLYFSHLNRTLDWCIRNGEIVNNVDVVVWFVTSRGVVNRHKRF
jgi:hypothetical protein